MVSRTRGGKAFITINEGEEPLMPRPVAAIDSAIACLSEKGRVLVFGLDEIRSEEHTSELQSLMRISYAVFCLKKKNNLQHSYLTHHIPISHKSLHINYQ